jgi:hypothetical protein
MRQALHRWITQAGNEEEARAVVSAWADHEEDLGRTRPKDEYLFNPCVLTPTERTLRDASGEVILDPDTQEPLKREAVKVDMGLLPAVQWGMMLVAQGIEGDNAQKVLNMKAGSTAAGRLRKLGLSSREIAAVFPDGLLGSVATKRGGSRGGSSQGQAAFGGPRMGSSRPVLEAPAPVTQPAPRFDVTAHVGMLQSRGLNDSQVLGIIMAKPTDMGELLGLVLDILAPAVSDDTPEVSEG